MGSTFNTAALPAIRSMHVSGLTCAGVGAASVEIQGSNDAVAGTWIVLGTVGLKLSTTRTTGVLLHYPAGQTNKTASGYLALEGGRTDNPSALLVATPLGFAGRLWRGASPQGG